MSFAAKLKQGQTMGEGPIACWLMEKGSSILPVYEKQIDTGKGPQLFTASDSYAAPDLLAFTPKGGPIFVESKYKSVFTWHRISRSWTTGIDLNHYEHYQQVQAKTGLPVWLLFFHQDSTPDNKDLRWRCPDECPIGLFGNELSKLTKCVNHTSLPKDVNRDGFLGHGRHGMVYWSESSLIKIAERDEVFEISDRQTYKLPVHIGGTSITVMPW